MRIFQKCPGLTKCVRNSIRDKESTVDLLMNSSSLNALKQICLICLANSKQLSKIISKSDTELTLVRLQLNELYCLDKGNLFLYKDIMQHFKRFTFSIRGRPPFNAKEIDLE